MPNDQKNRLSNHSTTAKVYGLLIHFHSLYYLLILQLTSYRHTVAKLFIHIGLPKTATTTLQKNIFQSLDPEQVHYVGVIQPREEPQSSLYLNFVHAINTGEISDSQALLKLVLGTGKSVLISEEMILVSENSIDWRTKLDNLAHLIQGLDYQLILTVREPTSGMHSYFVELYPQLIKENRNFLDAASNNPTMQIFHYNKLISELIIRFSMDRILIKKFEDIINGDIADIYKLLLKIPPPSASKTLEKHNIRNKSEDYIYINKTIKLTGDDLLQIALVRMGLLKHENRKRFLTLIHPLRRIIKNIRFNWTIKKVPVLSKEEKIALDVLLSKENQFAATLLGRSLY